MDGSDEFRFSQRKDWELKTAGKSTHSSFQNMFKWIFDGSMTHLFQKMDDVCFENTKENHAAPFPETSTDSSGFLLQ